MLFCFRRRLNSNIFYSSECFDNISELVVELYSGKTPQNTETCLYEMHSRAVLIRQILQESRTLYSSVGHLVNFHFLCV